MKSGHLIAFLYKIDNVSALTRDFCIAMQQMPTRLIWINLVCSLCYDVIIHYSHARWPTCVQAVLVGRLKQCYGVPGCFMNWSEVLEA